MPKYEIQGAKCPCCQSQRDLNNRSRSEARDIAVKTLSGPPHRGDVSGGISDGGLELNLGDREHWGAPQFLPPPFGAGVRSLRAVCKLFLDVLTMASFGKLSQ